jgi:hypothetical protein
MVLPLLSLTYPALSVHSPVGIIGGHFAADACKLKMAIRGNLCQTQRHQHITHTRSLVLSYSQLDLLPLSFPSATRERSRQTVLSPHLQQPLPPHNSLEIVKGTDGITISAIVAKSTSIFGITITITITPTPTPTYISSWLRSGACWRWYDELC